MLVGSTDGTAVWSVDAAGLGTSQASDPGHHQHGLAVNGEEKEEQEQVLGGSPEFSVGPRCVCVACLRFRDESRTGHRV